MKRSSLLVGFIGLSLVVGAGCASKEQQASKEQRESAKANQEGQEKLAEQKPQEAQEQFQKSLDEKRKAAENIGEAQEERVPVAGHDYMPLQRQVKDSLGNDWKVAQSGDSLVATRTTLRPPDKDMATKVDDQIKSISQDHPGLTGLREGNQVRLSGRLPDCKDAGGVANKFGGIDGVDKIEIQFSCQMKK